MRQGSSVEQQIIDLFSQLQQLVRRPTWSFQLEEVRILLTELVTCWDQYRRSSDDGDQRLLKGPQQAESAMHQSTVRHDHR
jgi:hypothetical protein